MSEVKNELETETTPAPAKKQRLSNDDLYRNSTQYELWSFTQETLQDAKREANEKGSKFQKRDLNLPLRMQRKNIQMLLNNFQMN